MLKMKTGRLPLPKVGALHHFAAVFNFCTSLFFHVKQFDLSKIVIQHKQIFVL
jgi:hypothetical protein